jgi:recombination protein RecR
LTSILEKFPGLGPKSARRLVLHLIKHKKELLNPLIYGLQDVANNIQECQRCFAWDTKSPCKTCTDQGRDPHVLCVVGDIIDMWAIERTKSFRGMYHILGGVLSAAAGYNPRNLTFEELFARVAREPLNEIIIALNPTIDGQTTMVYLLNELKKYPLKITTLAHGIPLGGELDYVDNGTIAMAFSKRWEAA